MAEMKAGYKQTDIGIIPEDWDIKSYGEVFDFLSTISNSRADLCFKGDFGYIHYGDIHTRWENTLDLSKSELPELRRDKIKKLPASLRDGDLVMADASEDYEGIAKTVEVKNIGDKKVFSGLHTFLMRDRNAVFSDGIRGYIHEMPVVRQQIQKVATGLKVFGVSKNTLKNVQIPVPKPEEQKQIAAALSDVDGLIESLSQLIAKKRDMKTAAMQQLLTGKKRLPGFDGEWENFALRDLATIRNQKINTLNSSIAQYCIELENIAPESGTVLSSSDATGRSSTKYIFKKGDVLFGRLRPYLKKFWSAECEGVCSTEIWPLMPLSQDFVTGFLSQLVRTDAFIAKACESYGTHMPRADWKVLGEMEIFLPKPGEQTAIATILSDMDTEIDALEQRLAKARSLKTGMMQELLTGKTRLLKTDKFQEAVA